MQQITKADAVERIKEVFRAKESKIYLSPTLIGGVELKTANGTIEQKVIYGSYWLGMIDDKSAKQQSEEAGIYSDYRLVFIDAEGRDYFVQPINEPIIIEPKLEEIV